MAGGYQAIITPIDIAGERLGTLFIYKINQIYEIDDIILSEYGTTVVGLEMLRSVNEENAEESRKEHIVQSAISTCLIPNWKPSSIFLMSWTEQKGSWWPARSPTGSALPDP